MNAIPSQTAKVLPWRDYLNRHYGVPSTTHRHAVFMGGLSSSCQPFEPTARALNVRSGAWVETQSLAGHDGDPAHFRRSRAWHYRVQGVAAIDRYYQKHRLPLIVGGYSVGSLVAAYYAIKHPERVKGLVMISPAVALASRYSAPLSAAVLGAYTLTPIIAAAYEAHRFRNRVSGTRLSSSIPWALAGAFALRQLLDSITVKRHPPQVWNTAEGPIISPHYSDVPLLVVASLLEFQVRMSVLLSRVSVPTLVILGELDTVLDVPAARRAVSQIKSVRVETLSESGHQLMSGPEESKYLDLVADFCNGLW